ncbi:MAG: glycosyltransferase family 39 protein [Candidatus Eisenbacteria bacterium]|nr:glycosyltransferase family 39 protein [Candidatus Eisenbacteria bacterium]
MAAVLRLFHLGHQSLWIDEVLTWFSADIGRRLPLEDVLDNVHGPLHSLVLHGFGAWAGDSEWALRLPSALFGIAMVPALARLAARWLGRETAAPAAWLAAGSPFLVWYSQEARNYTLLMLCVCLSGVVLLGDASRARRGLGYLAAAWAGLLANLSFALLAPLHLRWWAAGPRAGRTRRLAAAGLLAAALLLLLAPWALKALSVWDWQRLHPARTTTAGETPLRGGTTFHPAALPFAAHAFAVGYTLGPSLRELRAGASAAAVLRHGPELALTALVFGALGVLGLAAVARRRRFADLLLWALVPALVVSFFAARNFKVFHPRYLAVAQPAFLLVLAAGVADLGVRRRVLAAAAVALLWGASLGHHYFDPRYGKEDYRGAARLVAEQGRAGEQVLAVGAEDPVSYYYRGPLRVDRLWLGFASRPDRLAEKLDEKLAGARGTWVVLSRPEDLDPRGVFARMLDGGFPDAARHRLEGVRVWHLGPGAALRRAAP